MRTTSLAPQLRNDWIQCKRDGAVSARSRIINHYRHLVPKTRTHAVPSVPARVSVSDLEGDGYYALCRALDKFDPDLGVQFKSYAITLIRGAMLEHLRNEDPVPRSIRAKQKLLAAARERVASRHGPQEVTDERLAEELRLSLDALYQLYAAADTVQAVSMEEALGDTDQDDQDSLAVREALSSPSPGPEAQVMDGDQAERLTRFLGWLSAKERHIIYGYYFEGKSLKQLANEIGRSESRAHQLHTEALRRMRDFLQESDFGA